MEYRITNDYKQMECQGVHTIHLTQDSVKWLALMDSVTNFWIPLMQKIHWSPL
jgi:hypothetical protein